MGAPVCESIRFRLRAGVRDVTLIFPRAPARMTLLKNPPVSRSSTYQSVIIYLIGTFPYDDADRSPSPEAGDAPEARRWGTPTNLLPCSHTHCQDTCLTAHKLTLAIPPYVCYHARVHVCVRIPMGPHVPLKRAVSHAAGLSQCGLCVCLGVGVLAVLGPVQRRFGLVLIQTTQNRLFYACLMSTKPKPRYA